MQAMGTPSLKFWYGPGACSLAPHIVLQEIGAKFDAISLNAIKGITEDFRNINPKLRVPVLAVGDQTITEVPAIFTAISQLAPEKKLLGSTDLEVVRTYEWMNWLSGTLHGQGFGGLFRPARYIDDANLHKAIQKKAWETVQDCFRMIEEKLQGVHAVGDNFTVVDPYLYVFYRWGMGQTDMQSQYPKYARLVAELLKRESVKAALEVEATEAFGPKL